MLCLMSQVGYGLGASLASFLGQPHPESVAREDKSRSKNRDPTISFTHHSFLSLHDRVFPIIVRRLYECTKVHEIAFLDQKGRCTLSEPVIVHSLNPRRISPEKLLYRDLQGFLCPLLRPLWGSHPKVPTLSAFLL